MKKRFFAVMLAVFVMAVLSAQTALKKVYDENVNPIEQIDQAVAKAKVKVSSSSVRSEATGARGACVSLTS